MVIWWFKLDSSKSIRNDVDENTIIYYGFGHKRFREMMEIPIRNVINLTKSYRLIHCFCPAETSIDEQFMQP